MQPILSTQLTLVCNAWGNSTGPARQDIRDFPLTRSTKNTNLQQLLPSLPSVPTRALLYKGDDSSSLIFSTTTCHYAAKLPNSEGGLLSHSKKGIKTLIVGTFCILLKHLISQKYVISNQPILIVHLEYNQLFYCKITLIEK